MTGQADTDVFEALRASISTMPVHTLSACARSVQGGSILVDLPGVRIGEICSLSDPHTGWSAEAEVSGFDGDQARLTASGSLRGFSLATEIRPLGRAKALGISDALLGCVIDSEGQALDGAGTRIVAGDMRSLHAAPVPAMSRRPITRPLTVGLRVIDGLLVCGEGQRVGIFGAPGAGKSTLLTSLVSGAEADVCVVGLIGERGREVGEFVERLRAEGRGPTSVVVAETSDRAPIARVNAGYAAMTVAEHFRDQGKSVLLVIDSLTRFARSLRDIALTSGELPARRGFPTSVFAALPQLLERAGQGTQGAITAFFTVLTEGDADDDPLAEEVLGLLDGHISLSGDLAAQGHYPAIDILKSRSRVMPAITSDAHRRISEAVLAQYAKYRDVEFLLQIGEYEPGADAMADKAIASHDAIAAFLRQRSNEAADFEAAWMALQEVVT